MAAPPTIFIVCSDRSRNGKTLLARVLIDHLLMNGRDPFCFDLGVPEGTLRGFFPGRTLLIDFLQEKDRARLFDMIIARAGRDYVIDAAALQLALLCETANARNFAWTAHAEGFRLCILYIVDRDEKSLKTAVAVEEAMTPDLLVPVINRFVGTSLPDRLPGPVIMMEKIEHELWALIANRRFSLRSFMMGDEALVPARLRANLSGFLQGLAGDIGQLDSILPEFAGTPGAPLR